MATREKAKNTYEEGFFLGLKPDPLLTVSQWADTFRMLPRKSSAEPGRWRTSRTPYLREIMDSLSAISPVEQVKFMKGTQLGATEAGCNWFGYVAHLCPAPFMLVLPTIDLAEKHSKQKIAPTIEDTEVLRERIAVAKSRDSSNTTLIKSYPGGMLIIAGANSGTSFRNVSVRFLHRSDVDGYPLDVDGEGDPGGLAKNRTDAYGNRKIYTESTPTIRGLSMIEQEYEDSDQRKYYVPCPHCAEKQVLMWSGIIFDYDKGNHRLAGDVRYRCINCGTLIEEYYKTYMLEGGEWIPSNPGHPYRGYHLSSLYSPIGWLSWRSIVEEFLVAKKKRDRSLLKRWVNTRLAETYEEEGEALSGSSLFSRRETYTDVPEQVIMLCASCDVQKDRIEILVTGWGIGDESWAIEHACVYGDTSVDPRIKGSVWAALHNFITKTYMHAHGYHWRISATAIDTGYETDNVYNFVRPRQETMKVYAIKGMNTDKAGVPVISKPSKTIPGLDLYHIGTYEAKMAIFNRLSLAEAGPGYIHYNKTFTEDYFKQLTAEKIRTKYKNGFPYKVFEKPDGARNEALDLTVYNIACMAIALSRASTTLERIAGDIKGMIAEKEKKIPVPTPTRNRTRVVHGGVKL